MSPVGSMPQVTVASMLHARDRCLPVFSRAAYTSAHGRRSTKVAQYPGMPQVVIGDYIQQIVTNTLDFRLPLAIAPTLGWEITTASNPPITGATGMCYGPVQGVLDNTHIEGGVLFVLVPVPDSKWRDIMMHDMPRSVWVAVCQNGGKDGPTPILFHFCFKVGGAKLARLQGTNRAIPDALPRHCLRAADEFRAASNATKCAVDDLDYDQRHAGLLTLPRPALHKIMTGADPAPQPCGFCHPHFRWSQWLAHVASGVLVLCESCLSLYHVPDNSLYNVTFLFTQSGSTRLSAAAQIYSTLLRQPCRWPLRCTCCLCARGRGKRTTWPAVITGPGWDSLPTVSQRAKAVQRRRCTVLTTEGDDTALLRKLTAGAALIGGAMEAPHERLDGATMAAVACEWNGGPTDTAALERALAEGMLRAFYCRCCYHLCWPAAVAPWHLAHICTDCIGEWKAALANATENPIIGKVMNASSSTDTVSCTTCGEASLAWHTPGAPTLVACRTCQQLVVLPPFGHDSLALSADGTLLSHVVLVPDAVPGP